MTRFAVLAGETTSPIDVCAAFLQAHPMATMALGRYEVTETIFVNLMEYDTKPYEEGVFEAHREYADLQVVIAGEECAYYGDVTAMEQEPYREEGDYLLCRTADPVQRVTLSPGAGALFLPADAHMPGITAEAPCHVRKAVFKIPVALLAD